MAENNFKDRKYVEGIGRRKNASARVRVYFDGSGKMTVNEKPAKEFFKFFEFEKQAMSPLEILGITNKTDVSVKVLGGGMRGQAEAIRHGVARALLKADENNRLVLRKAGFLTRDPRAKERKKPGLKRARRAPQWRKR
jgi:small subunit ribosomal protein S9